MRDHFLEIGAYGISCNIYSCFQNFVCNKWQRVIINGEISSLGSITSGFHQVSDLGPFLFD